MLVFLSFRWPVIAHIVLCRLCWFSWHSYCTYPTHPGSKSPVDSVSSKVQAVVTMAAPFNLASFNQPEDTAMANNFVLSAVGAYMGSLPAIKSGNFVLSGKYVDASPLTMVTADAAPTLIYYSDNDPVIPARQAKEMYEQLKQHHVAVKLVARHGEEHNPLPDMTEVCKWFETYLH